MIAAIYARKSNEQNGVADEAKSVTRQVEHAKDYAQRKGWQAADEFVYVDDGISGAEFAKRPSFVRLLAAVAAKPRPFDVLVMSEGSRLGREQIETAYALKQIIKNAGIRVFYYLTDTEAALSSATDKLLLSVASFADEMEREKASLRIRDGMKDRDARGAVKGGRTFGYDNVDVIAGLDRDGRPKRAFVDRRINEPQAAVVRRIFARCAEGAGVKRIANELNVAGAVAPSRSRPAMTWAAPTVRAVLGRELYAGRIPTRVNGAIVRPDLAIVTSETFAAAQKRIQATAATYMRDPNGTLNGKPCSGVEAKYLLTGLSRCTCGGGLMAYRHGAGTARWRCYTCRNYHDRGASVCANGLPLPMAAADAAVLGTLERFVLRPDIIEGALVDALGQLRPTAGVVERQRADLERQARKVGQELERFKAAIGAGGALTTLLDGLKDAERRQAAISRQLDGLDGLRHVADFDVRKIEKALRARLDDWKGLLGRQPVIARQILGKLLVEGRLVFTPHPEDRSYTFAGQAQLGKLLQGVVLPEVADTFRRTCGL